MKDPFGCYRVLDPPGALPQNCWKIDNDPAPRFGETAVDVEILNVDSSSFLQLLEQSRRDKTEMADLILRIVEDRGKLHNPVTGSGGMLIGSIPQAGSLGRLRIASLVSLTLTPLRIDAIRRIDTERERVYVAGTAILFEQTLYCPLPSDLPETVALVLFDVLGAPAQCARLCPRHNTILILGAGKAGLLSAASIRRENPAARILVIDTSAEALAVMHRLGLCDWSATLDARYPLAVFEAILAATDGRLCDLTINVVNQPGTEGSSILATRQGGVIYFFSMATSFPQAALTAEGLARDVQMIIGSGYTPGWIEYALDLLRGHVPLRRYFEQQYGE